MNFFKRTINLLLNGGITNEKYKLVVDDIWEANRKSLIVYSAITMIGMTILLILSFFSDTLESSMKMYILALNVSALIFVLSITVAKKFDLITLFCVFLFTASLFAFGIILGTVVDTVHASASFGILIFAVPLLFTDRPILTILEQIIAMIIYTICAKNTQSQEVFKFNMSFVIPYGIAALFISLLNMKSKIKKFLLDYENKVLGETDQLTGLLNRRSYENKLKELSNSTEDFYYIFVAFDVNGLKKVNDILGHKAGDELICACANTIKEVFSSYGECYRTGGDEFFACVKTSLAKFYDLEDKFIEACKGYKGKLIESFTASFGYVECRKASEVTDAINKADNKMYQNKTKFYD